MFHICFLFWYAFKVHIPASRSWIVVKHQETYMSSHVSLIVDAVFSYATWGPVVYLWRNSDLHSTVLFFRVIQLHIKWGREVIRPRWYARTGGGGDCHTTKALLSRGPCHVWWQMEHRAPRFQMAGTCQTRRNLAQWCIIAEPLLAATCHFHWVFGGWGCCAALGGTYTSNMSGVTYTYSTCLICN